MQLTTLLVALMGLAQAENLQQKPLQTDKRVDLQGISDSLFSSLERFARLVDIAYCVGTTGLTQPFSCASRCREFPFMELISTWNTGPLLSDSCGYIAADHGGNHPDSPAIIIAFRGTYSITNTIVDLSTIPQEYVPYPSSNGEGALQCDNCTVHMGFWESWNMARKEIMPLLMELRHQHPDYTIHLLGHSLGGAVAALAALELRVSWGFHNIKVTTFGEPRVGNAGLVAYIDRIFSVSAEQASGPDDWSYRRITHVKDPVPLLPLSEWGYRSHASELFIQKPELPPHSQDLIVCGGDNDANCSGGADGNIAFLERFLEYEPWSLFSGKGIPTRFKMWQFLFAHRDYFWRLGLCVP